MTDYTSFLADAQGNNGRGGDGLLSHVVAFLEEQPSDVDGTGKPAVWSCKQLVAAALKRGWTTTGATPHQTLSAQLQRHVSRPDARVVKAGPGRYVAKAVVETAIAAAKAPAVVEPTRKKPTRKAS